MRMEYQTRQTTYSVWFPKINLESMCLHQMGWKQDIHCYSLGREFIIIYLK